MGISDVSYVQDPLLVDALWSHPTRLFSGDNGSGAISTCIEWLNGYNVAGDEDGVQFLVGITGTATSTQFQGDSSAISTKDDAYRDKWVLFIAGRNAGQRRRCTAYEGATKTFTCEAFPYPPSGADQFYILTIPGIYDVQNQRYGGRLITAGVGTNDTSLIHRGFKVLMFAVQYLQGTDGTPFKSADNWHQTSIFLEEALRGISVLEQSGLSLTPWRRAIDQFREMAARWVRWMLSTSAAPGFNTGKNRNWPYTHRRFLCAAAWLWVYQYTGDTGILQNAVSFIQDGLNWQFSPGTYAGTYERIVSGTPYYAAGATIADITITNSDGNAQTIHPDGIFPELWTFPGLPAGQAGGVSGWDVSYQNSSVRFACVCHDILPSGYSSLQSSLIAAVQRGCVFERQLLRSNNLLETVGSTRIGNGDLTPSGAPKGVNYFDAFESFMMAQNLGIDTSANRAAANKLAYGQGWVSSLSY